MAMRILLVEDEEDNLTLVQHVLTYLLHEDNLRIARDGREAMLLAYEFRPELILMDLTIPKLNGWETTRSLKSDEAFRDVPILALTAHAMVGDRARALEAGCDDYFPKPIDIDAFIQFITPYLNSGAGKPPAASAALTPAPSAQAANAAPDTAHSPTPERGDSGSDLSTDGTHRGGEG